MSIHIDKRAWVPQQVAAAVFTFALWALPAHAESCNAVRLDQQSLAIHWDEQTIASCLNEAQQFKTEIDKDPLEGAMHAVDDVCAQFESNHLSGDVPATVEKVCAKLRAGIKSDPAH